MTTTTTTTTTATAQVLPPVLAALVDRVRIAPDRCSALVDDHLVTAGDPVELRKDLSGQVYSLLHAGQPPDLPDLPFHTRDRGFEQRLVQELPHRTSTVLVPVLSAEGGTAVVLRDGVRVLVATDDLEVDGPVEPGSTAVLRIPSARALLSPGFLFVDGTRSSAAAPTVVRVYVHLRSAEQALEVWRRTLPYLEASGAPYRAKVLSAPVLYPRRDALVVYLDGRSADVTASLARHLQGGPALDEPTPAFAQRLAPGVSVAWEPTDPRREYQGLSFGQHRAQVLVDALCEAAETGEPVAQVVLRTLATANVDPERPHRNGDTPDHLAATG